MMIDFRGITNTKKMNDIVAAVLEDWKYFGLVDQMIYLEAFLLCKSFMLFLTTERPPEEQTLESVIILLEGMTDGNIVPFGSTATEIVLNTYLEKNDATEKEWARLFKAANIGNKGHLTYTVGSLLRWLELYISDAHFWERNDAYMDGD